MDSKPDDEKAEQGDQAAERSKRKRAAPTIELKASSVSDRAPAAQANTSAASSSTADPAAPTSASQPAPDPSPVAADPVQPARSQADPVQSESRASPSPHRSAFGAASLIIPAVTGAAAAAAVVAILWVAGIATRPASVAGSPSAPTQTTADITAATDALAARIAKLEANPGAAPSSKDNATPSAASTTDSELTARVAALEKSISSLRDSVESGRAETEKIGAIAGEVKKAQADAPPLPDLTPLEDRISKLEKATVSLTAQAATPPPSTTPPENPKIRAAVAATALDSAVRQGEPYTVMLSNVAATTDNGAALKPLEPFAASGIPSARSLCGELLALVTKADVKPDAGPPSGDVFDRLRLSASKLVKIERTDTASSERASALTRIAAAARRDDLAESKREVMALAPSDLAPFQAWLNKVAAREAALDASRQFASDAMLSLSSSAR